MTPNSTKRRVAIGLAAVSLASGFALSSGSMPAAADPMQLSALVGAGSDTTMEIMNAMSGFSSGIGYRPINSGATGGYKHLASWDATPAQTASDNCITPVINGPTFTRPNGSTEGRKSLYASSTSAAAGWTGKTFTLDSGTVLPVCATAVNIGGTINFARSSSSGSGTGNDVVFVPFARDGITYATYRPDGGTPLTSLTRKNLIDAFNSDTRITVPDPDGTGDLTIIPCGIQKGSGTFQSFQTVISQSTSGAPQEDAATLQCNNMSNGSLTGGARVQESKGDLLKQKGDWLNASPSPLAGTNFVVVSGFSAAAYIAQSNGVAPANGVANISIGGISDNSTSGSGGANLGSPVSGTAPNMAPNTTFYADSTFGRNVFNVVRRSLLVNTSTLVPLSNAYVAIFADTDTDVNTTTGVTGGPVDNSASKNSSTLCQEGARLQLFGFAETELCGSYTFLTRPWETGAS